MIIAKLLQLDIRDFDRYEKCLTNEYKSWYENGQLDREFYRDGDMEERKFYHENGQLFSRELYRNGKVEGCYRQWHDNGHPESTSFYRNGKSEGSRTFWFPDGHVEIKDFCRNGKREGICKIWNEDGQCEFHAFYRNDQAVDANFTFRKKRVFLRIIRSFRKRIIHTANTILISDLSNIICQL